MHLTIRNKKLEIEQKDISRFLKKVKKQEDGCWVWQASVQGPTRQPYGSFKLKNRTVAAHRFSYAAFVEDPGKKFVLHSCDVPLCVNPNHLRSGTPKDNMDDKFERGREFYPSRLSEKTRHLIFILYTSGLTQEQIADQLYLAQSTVSRVLNNKL